MTKYHFINETMKIDEFVEELQSIIHDKDRIYSFITDRELPLVVKNGVHCIELQALIRWLEQLSYEKRLAAEAENESTVRTIPQFSLAVGKLSNSCKHSLGEYATDEYVARIALDQIDDTCFDEGWTFYSLEDAIRGIKAGIEHGDNEFAKEICNGLLFGLSHDWSTQDCEDEPPF